MEDIEVASPEARRELQNGRLRVQVEHAYKNSPFYRRKFDELGIDHLKVRTVDDLKHLPFTTKEDLKQDQVDNPPWGSILAEPFEKCLRIHQSSGTTGEPVKILDTRDDWYGFYHSYARSLYAMGVREKDVVLCAFSYGPWIGFWSGFHAAQDLGCLVIPGGGSTDQRLDLLERYPISVLGCTPSYALYFAEAAEKRGVSLDSIKLSWHTGEPGAGIPSTKQKLEKVFNSKAFDLPGLTELLAWGYECRHQSGLTHVHDDYVYPEVLDTETLEPVGPGERGILHFTSLFRKAFPLLRYCTNDIVEVADEQCPCGRTQIACKGGVIGRHDDMKKIRGVIVYPSQIEEAVRRFDDVDEFAIIIRRDGNLDEVLVQVDPNPELSADEVDNLVSLVGDEVRNAIGIRVATEGVDPGSLPRWDHKAKRLQDLREDVPF